MTVRTLLGLAAIVVIGGALSLSLSDYSLRLMNLAVVSAIAVIGLNFAFGYAGLISLGHSAFAGLSAYAVAILTTRLGWSPWIAMPVAVTGTALAAALIGYPLLRLKGHYLALATLGFNVSFGIIAMNWIDLTGGTNGISGIPHLSIAGHELADERSFLWFALFVLVLVAAAAAAIHRSRYGRAMISVRDDEIAAAMAGIDVTNVKVAAFTLAGACAAIAGCLFATHIRFVAPEDFNYAHSITYLAMLIVGGEGTIAGAIIGAIVLTFLPEWLRVLGDAYLLFFGLMMLTILVFLPTGIVGLVRRLPWKRRSRDAKAANMPARAGAHS